MVSRDAVENVIKELGLTPAIEKARFGKNIARAYSPDQITMIRGRLAAKTKNKS